MFETDSQTLKDLQIFPSAKGVQAVISIFDEVASFGGKYKLDELFRRPLSDPQDIRDRTEYIQYIENNRLTLKIERDALDFIEYYLKLYKIPSRYSYIDGIRRYWADKIKPDNEYYIITRAIKWLMEIIQGLYDFANDEACETSPVLMRSFSDTIHRILDSDDFEPAMRHKRKRLSIQEITRFDHIFRYRRRDDIRALLDIIYQIDVFQSVISVKNKLGFVFADIKDGQCLNFEGLYHPLLQDPVPNDMLMQESRIGFITGANMAGKSTFMKAFGISLYLAHMGFPVPARKMEFSVFDGLFSSINVPDDLSLGYSHFYAEIKRIKSIAEKVSSGKKYVVILDELFRGTNVKDAHEATVTVIRSFGNARRSLFLFSTHILEAAEELGQTMTGNILFRYFKTDIDGKQLKYSYKMHEGISEDRFGMHILKMEGIEELLMKSNSNE